MGDGVGARREDGDSLSYTYYIGFLKIATIFVEIEAIDKDGSFGEEKLNKQCQEFLHLLDIKKEDLIDHSYSDMLIKQ